MTIYAQRRRVACYVTRAAAGGEELLVFEHAFDDPNEPSGVQVPAGGMVTFESVEAAARREIAEETGLAEVEFVGQLGGQEVGLEAPGGAALTTYVHVTAPAGGPDSWEHKVTGAGDDNGLVFVCRWERLPLTLELAGGQGEFLDALTS